jgi:UDP-N-acetylglucosamine acyltransferase
VIDDRAMIDASARIADDVHIGPWSYIGPNVEIGTGTVIGPHVVIKGPTCIGRYNKIYQFASIGEDPQDKKYKGEPTRLEIGDNNIIRESCTISRGTVQGGSLTRVGNNNLFMAYVHIAHDCIVNNNTIFSNNASLSGHVTVDDYAILSGFSGVHQFCHIGAHSFLAMGTLVGKDIPPYVLVSGAKASPHGLNAEGLKRRGFSAMTIRWLRRAYKVVYRQGLLLNDAIHKLEAMVPECAEINLLLEFLRHSTRGIIR